MTDARAAVRTIFRGQEFVDASDYDALRAENERLRADKIDLLGTLRAIGSRVGEEGDELAILARVSELTRLLAEAEEWIDRACDLIDDLVADNWSSVSVDLLEQRTELEKHPALQRALQSGEGKDLSR